MAQRKGYRRWRDIMDEGSQSAVVSCKDRADWVKKLGDENKDKLVVAYFSADWCGPCRFIYPIVEYLAHEYKDRALFIKIDVDKLQDIAQEQRVDALPTFVLFKNKAVVDRVRGARKEALMAAVVEHLPPPNSDPPSNPPDSTQSN